MPVYDVRDIWGPLADQSKAPAALRTVFPVELAEQGMRRALDHAESDEPGWGDKAFSFLKAYALKNEHFCGYMVTMASELDAGFPSPENEKAWGAIYKKALKNGVIEKTEKRMPHPRRHASEAIVYRSRIFA